MTRTALFTHLNIVLLASFFAAERFEFFFIETLAGIGAIFSIANMTRRSQLIISALIVMVIYMLSHTALTFILESKSNDIALNDYAVYGASALMILIAYPMIFVFEKMFGFVSDFTLLELSDSNSLLLRELATKAPGTFQHTLQVASLAEEAIQKQEGTHYSFVRAQCIMILVKWKIRVTLPKIRLVVLIRMKSWVTQEVHH